MNTNELKQDSHYGEILGKYTILERIVGSDKYVVKCNKCGYINHSGARLVDVRYSDPNSICNHHGNINSTIDDHVGEIHGKFEILKCLNKRDIGRHMLYEARCVDCGKIFSSVKIADMDKVKAGTPCNHKPNPLDRIGETIGKYHILDYIGLNKHGKHVYKVQCINCGYINYKGMTYSEIMASIDCTSKCTHRNLTFENYVDMSFFKEQQLHPDKEIICAVIKYK